MSCPSQPGRMWPGLPGPCNLLSRWISAKSVTGALVFLLSGEVDGMCSREAELPMDPAAPAAGPCAACVQEGRFGP